LSKKATLWSEKRAAAIKRSINPEGALEDALDQLEKQNLAPYDPQLQLDDTLGEHLNKYESDYEVTSDMADEVAAIKLLVKRIDAGHFTLGHKHELPPSTIAYSSKLQLSPCSATDDLLKFWASAENRAVSDVALFALETGLKALRAQGAIPEAALDATERRSAQRLAQAEARAVVKKALADVQDPIF